MNKTLFVVIILSIIFSACASQSRHNVIKTKESSESSKEHGQQFPSDVILLSDKAWDDLKTAGINREDVVTSYIICGDKKYEIIFSLVPDKSPVVAIGADAGHIKVGDIIVIGELKIPVTKVYNEYVKSANVKIYKIEIKDMDKDDF